MMPEKPQTKEQLITYLSTSINLGSYDKKFINNICSKRDPITTNQETLLNRLIFRYQKQLAKNGLNAHTLAELSWETAPIVSSPNFTEAWISIDNDSIKLSSPYKKKFVNELRSLPYSNWNPIDKVWTIALSETSLREVIQLVSTNYDNVNLCDNIKNILDTVALYHDIKYWDPTLIQRNNSLYIAASNEALDIALTNITLNTELATLARLTYYGIRVDHDLIVNINNEMGNTSDALSDLLFALSFAPAQIEISDIDLIIRQLRLVNPDVVILYDWFVRLTEYMSEIVTRLEQYAIPYIISSGIEKLDITKFEFPIIISYGMKSAYLTSDCIVGRIAKIVRLKNTNKIDIL
jgi:hypothetical protein